MSRFEKEFSDAEMDCFIRVCIDAHERMAEIVGACDSIKHYEARQWLREKVDGKRSDESRR